MCNGGKRIHIFVIFISLKYVTYEWRITTPQDSIQQIHHISDELSIIRIRLGQSIIGFQIQDFFFK